MSKHSRKRKRHYSDSDEYVRKKIRKLEKKLRKKKTRRSSSSSSSDNSMAKADEFNYYDELSLDPCDEEAISIHSNMENEHMSNTPSNETTTVTSQIVAQTSTSQSEVAQTSTSAVSVQQTVEQPEQAVSSENVIPELDQDILALLGESPSKDKKYAANIKDELALRWNHIVTTGLTKETRKELTEKYLIPDNCKNIDAPILNPEIKAALSETLIKKDKAIENKQKERAAALSSFGEALTRMFDLGYKEPTVLKPLLEAARIICDLQHHDSLVRRSFVCSTLKKEVKDQLYNTEIDKYLFGEKLADTLKAAKAIHKSGTEIKIPSQKPKKTFTGGARSLNSKPPLHASRSTGVSRKPEPAADTSHQQYHRHQASTRTPHAQAPSRPPPRSQARSYRRR